MRISEFVSASMWDGTNAILATILNPQREHLNVRASVVKSR
jgi:hypothetical protein